MAKGQKKLQETATARDKEDRESATAARERLIDGSPEFKAFADRTTANRKTIDEGTFADSKDFLSNRDAVAARTSQRKAQINMADTGYGAVGARYADPNQLAITNAIMDDEFARDSAMQAESDKRDFITQNKMDQSDVVNKKIGVDSTVMGSGFNQSNYNFGQAAQIASSRASLVPGLIGTAIGGFSSVYGGYLAGRGK